MSNYKAVVRTGAVSVHLETDDKEYMYWFLTREIASYSKGDIEKIMDDINSKVKDGHEIK